MPNTKKISLAWSETGKTVFCIIRREVDLFRLNDADGTFSAAPADPYLSLAEDAVIKGLYEVSEARTVWNNGNYFIFIYRQTGATPVPASDMMIGSSKMQIVSDTEVDSADVTTIDGIVDDILTDTGTTLPATLSTIAGYLDTEVAAIKAKTDTINDAGTLIWAYTLTDSVTGAPISDAEVIITSDSAGIIVLRTGRTNSAGVATFYFSPADSGLTVYIWCSKAGYNFTMDQEIVS